MITLDAMKETIDNSIINNGSMEMLEKCTSEAYITSTGIKKVKLQILFTLLNAGNLEIILKAKNTNCGDECSAAAQYVTSIINDQGDGSSVTTTADPVASFLTAGSALEVEVDQVTAENEAKVLLSPFSLVLAIIAAAVIMI